MIEYLQDQKGDQWSNKVKDEFITRWQQSFTKKRAYIDSIRQVASQYNWKTVDMDYQTSLIEQFITQRIRNIA